MNHVQISYYRQESGADCTCWEKNLPDATLDDLCDDLPDDLCEAFWRVKSDQPELSMMLY